MTSLERFLNALHKLEMAICFLAFAAMALILMVDVGMREIVGIGWYGASQRATIAMVILVFIALGLATSSGVHLRPRFADDVLTASWQPVILRLSDLVTAVFYLFVAVVAVYVVRDTAALEERVHTIHWILWPFQLVIVFAFGMGAVRHVIYFIYPALRPLEDDHGIDDEDEDPML